MNAREIQEIDGGNPIVDFVIDYVIGAILDFVADAAVNHMNNGAGYGGYMNTHGKL